MQTTVNVGAAPRLSMNVVLEGSSDALNRILRAIMNEVDETTGVTVKYVATAKVTEETAASE